MAFLQLEPLAADRADTRESMHTAAVLNCWRSEECEAILASDLEPDWLAMSEPAAELPAEVAAADPVAEADQLIAMIGARFPVG